MKIQYVIAIHLMRWLSDFYDFRFKWTATAAIEIHPTKTWLSQKMQSGCEDTLEERCAIKLCFKLGKNATETCGMIQTGFRPSCMNRASVFEWHKRFKEGKEKTTSKWRHDNGFIGNKQIRHKVNEKYHLFHNCLTDTSTSVQNSMTWCSIFESMKDPINCSPPSICERWRFF